MDNQEHWYYLHENGSLIHKNYMPEEEPGGLVKKVWRCNLEDRQSAWNILIEGLALGANIDRVKELASKWSCDGEDLPEYLLRTEITKLRQIGVAAFISEVLGVHPDSWFGWLSRTPTGAKPDYSTMPTKSSHGQNTLLWAK